MAAKKIKNEISEFLNVPRWFVPDVENGIG